MAATDAPADAEFFTPEEVAVRLRARGATFLRRGASKGKFPHHRIGVKIMFTEDDIKQIIALLARPATAESTGIPAQPTGGPADPAAAFRTSRRSRRRS